VRERDDDEKRKDREKMNGGVPFCFLMMTVLVWMVVAW
jgi:hypothetical protein